MGVELLRALGVLAEPPAKEHGRIAELLDLPTPPGAAAYSSLFEIELPPYASVYVGPEGLVGGVAQDRVAGFWRALHQTLPAEPDHLGSLLGLAAALAEAESAEVDSASARLLRRSRAALLWEHLLPWVPPFLGRVEEVADGFYGAWARLLADTLRAELSQAGCLDALPRHLAEAPPLPDPRVEGAGPFLDGLMAPVRSGLILLRRDLARAAADLGLALRAGERRSALEALLTERPGAVLEWLAEEARTRAAGHDARFAEVPTIKDHWVSRATATADLMESLTLDVGAVA